MLSGAPQAPWLRFLEGDGTGGTPGSTPGTGTPAPNADGTKPDGTKPDGDKPPAKETDWKAEARKWEQRAKENSKAAEELQKLEDAKKSELEKERERADKAERRAQELEAAQTRRDLAEKVSAEKRVPVQLLMRGGGDTEESMEAYADEILAYRNGGDPKPGVVKKSGTDGDNKDKVTSSVAAGRERFEARRNKQKSS
jgi:hypothetical protein